MTAMACHTCGCQGNEDDGIEIGGACVTDYTDGVSPCEGTVVYVGDVYGLAKGTSQEVNMLAPTGASAKFMAIMFGPGWKYRKLTPAEVADPWVQGEVAAMVEAGVWES